jgi:RimJ/RimL family protein N-acetyltransferase
MTVRPAAFEDARALAEVQVAAWHAAYRGLMPDARLAEFTVDKRAALWQRMLENPRSTTTILIEAGGSLAGYCLFGPTRDEDGKHRPIGEIIALNVRPKYWRRGFGKELCEFALREAPARKWRSVTLWVLQGNERAQRFYEALGFALDGSERTDTKLIGAPLHEFRYSKAI